MQEAPGSVHIPETYLAKVLVQWLRPEGQICGLNRSMNVKYEQLQWRMWETHTGTFQAFSSARPLRSSCPIWSKSVRHGHKVNTHAHTHTFPFFSWESGLYEGLVGDKLRSRAHGCSVFSHCSWGSAFVQTMWLNIWTCSDDEYVSSGSFTLLLQRCQEFTIKRGVTLKWDRQTQGI